MEGVSYHPAPDALAELCIEAAKRLGWPEVEYWDGVFHVGTEDAWRSLNQQRPGEPDKPRLPDEPTLRAIAVALAYAACDTHVA